MKQLFIALGLLLAGAPSGTAQEVTIQLDYNKPPTQGTPPELFQVSVKDKIIFEMINFPRSASVLVNNEIVETPSTIQSKKKIELVSQGDLQYRVDGSNPKPLNIDLKKSEGELSLQIILAGKRRQWLYIFQQITQNDRKLKKSEKLAPIPDAIKIASALKAMNSTHAETILMKYGLHWKNISGNPYLGHLKGSIKENDLQGSDLNLSGFTRSLASSTQSIVPEQAVLEGIAQFIVQRFKSEINAWFLDGFRKNLDSIPGLKILLPETGQVLQLSNPYNYPIFIQTFREAFQSDLKDLARNFITLLNEEDEMKRILDALKKVDPSIDILYDEIKPAVSYLNLASFMDELLRNGEDLPDAIESLPGQYDRRDNFKGVLNLAALLSKGMRDESGDWVGGDKIAALYDSDIPTFNFQPFWIFWGLMHQVDSLTMNDISFSSGKLTLRDFLGKMNAESFSNFFEVFQRTTREGISTFKIGQALMQQYKQNGTLSAENFDPFVLSIHDFIEEVVNLAMEISTKNDSVLCKVKFMVLPATKEVWSAVMEGDKKNYGLCISHIVTAFNIIVDPGLGNCPNSEKTSHRPKSASWGKELMKYGSFMVTMVNAKTAEDVEVALESAALPVGSYTIKRQNHLTIGLNSWVGPSTGIEYLTAEEAPNNSRTKAVFSLMAPIGPYFSLGPNASNFDNDSKKHKCKSSVFLMASILDLGALVNFRLWDSTTQDLPDITFKNFLAPGIHAGINPFPRAPVSIGGYWQYGPLAREVTKNGATLSSPGWKAGLWLGIDISIFNFYTRPDSKKNSPWFRSAQ